MSPYGLYRPFSNYPVLTQHQPQRYSKIPFNPGLLWAMMIQSGLDPSTLRIQHSKKWKWARGPKTRVARSEDTEEEDEVEEERPRLLLHKRGAGQDEGRQDGQQGRKRASYSPWQGKRKRSSYSPWQGKRSAKGYTPWQGKRSAKGYTPWQGKRSGGNYSPWQGKRAKNYKPGGKRDIEEDEEEKRAIKPGFWNVGKRDNGYSPWKGKRSAAIDEDERYFPGGLIRDFEMREPRDLINRIGYFVVFGSSSSSARFGFPRLLPYSSLLGQEPPLHHNNKKGSSVRFEP